MPDTAAARLAEQVAEELTRPAPEAAAALAELIVQRLGPDLEGILFYGSCLRRQTHEGVLDFYALVGDYSRVYDSPWLARANRLLPPNVFYVELPWRGETLRAKYAVISTDDFERAVQPNSLHPYIWSRFAQPALMVHARGSGERQRVERLVAQAIVTLVQRLGVFMPTQGHLQRFSLAALWHEAFRRTYTAELRTEAPEAVRGLYEAAPSRYDALGALALEVLRDTGWLAHLNARANAAEVEISSGRLQGARWRWRLTRPVAKALALVRLLKTAFTFGDWLPYALWKVERHSGARVELSERQRRHPLVFGWPVLFRLIARRNLR